MAAAALFALADPIRPIFDDSVQHIWWNGYGGSNIGLKFINSLGFIAINP